VDVTRVFVHIERVVLNGIGAAERDALATGLRDELTRVLAAPEAVGRLAAVGHVARLRVDAVSGKTDAGRTGAAVARGIDRALGARHEDAAR
jgi:hypothetical protein